MNIECVEVETLEVIFGFSEMALGLRDIPSQKGDIENSATEIGDEDTAFVGSLLVNTVVDNGGSARPVRTILISVASLKNIK